MDTSSNTLGTLASRSVNGPQGNAQYTSGPTIEQVLARGAGGPYPYTVEEIAEKEPEKVYRY